MPNITCPNVVDCPGSDWPILNLSSEGPDNLVFVGTVYDPFNPYQPPPVDGRSFLAHDCYGTSFSVESQEIAELIAQVNAIICGSPPIPDPLHPQDPPRPGYCLNDEQTATIICGNGTEVAATVPAGMIAVPSNGNESACLAAANAQALALAQQRASALSGNCPHCDIGTVSPLPAGSIGVPYAVQLISNMAPGATWSLIGGSLPPGLTLSLTGLISGTPTNGGSYTFAVQVQLRAGSCYKNLQIKIPSKVLPIWYFKCDEADGAGYLLESMTSRQLVLSSGATVSIPGKIAGGIGLGNGINTMWRSNQESFWSLSGSFTLRFWFRTGGTSTNQWMLGTDDVGQWDIQYLPDYPDMLMLTVQTTGGSLFLLAPTFNDNLWHYYVWWFEDGVGIGVKVDNGAPTLTPGTDPLQPDPIPDFRLMNTHFWDLGVGIDEIGLWNKKLTDAEITADWNSGNGKTYP